MNHRREISAGRWPRDCRDGGCQQPQDKANNDSHHAACERAASCSNGTTRRSTELRLTRARYAEAPPALGGEALEEVEVVGPFRRLPDQFVEPLCILADQVRQRSALTPSRMMVAASAAVVGASSRNRRVRSIARVWMSASDMAATSWPAAAASSRVRAISAAANVSDSLPLWIFRELAEIEVPMWPGITTEHLICGACTARSVISASVKPFTANFAAQYAVWEMRGPDRCPETVDAAGVDDVRLVGLLQHRQEGARAQIDAAPADVEGPLPRFAAVGEHAAAATDAGVVEQQMDPIGRLLLGHLVAKPLHLAFVRHVGDVDGDAQALRQSCGLAKPFGLGHRLREEIAHGDVTAFRGQLSHQLPAHAGAAAGHHRDLVGKLLHGLLLTLLQ